MRLSLSRTDGGGFLRLARMATAPAPAGRTAMAGGFPGLMVGPGACGFAASALRVTVARALDLEDCRIVPALPADVLGGVLEVARTAVRDGEDGLWLVLHADGATEAMGIFDFGGFLCELSLKGHDVVVTPADRAEADGARAWFEDFHAPAAMAG